MLDAYHEILVFILKIKYSLRFQLVRQFHMDYLFYLLATLLSYEWCWVPTIDIEWNISVYFIN